MAKFKDPTHQTLAVVFSVLLSGVLVLWLHVASQRKPKKSKPKAAPVAAQQQKPDPIFEHGFRVGYGMAKTGQIKPNSEQLDAMARQAALQMHNKGGLGFKLQWKQGFSFGWMEGD